MTNGEIIFKAGIFNIVVSQVALSLGITTDVMTRVDDIALQNDLTVAEAIIYGIQLVINNIASFLQLLTFQVNIPPIWNTLIFAPIALVLAYVIISLIRGSS